MWWWEPCGAETADVVVFAPTYWLRCGTAFVDVLGLILTAQ